ncbi:MarR family winged helix-turn-helix transcriptional regulator [Bacillus sp. JJ634]
MKQYSDFFNSYSLVHRPLTNYTNHILEKHGLSSSYWRLLRVLENGESKSFRDITDALKIEKPSVTNIIKKLSDLEIVEIHSGQDKRVKMVKLTPYGKDKMAEIRNSLNPFFEYALQGLSHEQLEIAVEVLDTIRKNITKL